MQPPAIDRIKALGFRVFEGRPYDLNLFGIRSKVRTAGNFDDLIGCAWLEKGAWCVRYWPGTTDPGVRNGELATHNPKGAAVLAPGQYRGAYQIGTHKGYRALVQTGAPVSVFRDNTGDTSIDMDKSTLETGYFGINIHASVYDPYNTTGERVKVGGWSEGCNVHATTAGFLDMMRLVDLQMKHHPTWGAVSYTLLDQWW